MINKVKLANKKDYLRIRSLSYWIRQALGEVENMPPYLREQLGQVIGDCDLTTFKDLATLEKVLAKISFR